MISRGTRNPNPIGPEMAGVPIAVESGTVGTVMYSPGVPGGAMTGGTWSKNPPFSSYVTKSTVFAQMVGLAINAEVISDSSLSPNTAGAGGWSEATVEPINQETWGKL